MAVKNVITLLALLGLVAVSACDSGQSPTDRAKADRSERRKSDADRLSEFYRLIRAAGEAGRASQIGPAIELYNEALTLQPKSEAACVGLANLMIECGRVDRAAILLQNVVQWDRNNARALMSLSRLYSDARPGGRVDLELASEYCEAAFRVNGEDTAVWLQRGRVAFLTGQEAAAMESLQATLDTNTMCGEAAVLMAQLHLKKGRSQDAAQVLVAFLTDHVNRMKNVPKGATEEGDTSSSRGHGAKLPPPVQLVASFLSSLLNGDPKLERVEGVSKVKGFLPPAERSLPAAAGAARPPSETGATYLRFGPPDLRSEATIEGGAELRGFLSRAYVTAAAAEAGKRLVVGAVHDGAPNDLLFFELDGRLPDANELPRFRIVVDHVVTSLSMNGDLLAVAAHTEALRLLQHGKGAASAHDGGAWNDVTAEKGLPTDLTASSVLFMDMDNDGRVDLLVAAAAGGIRVFIQSATGSFVDAGVDFIQGELPGVVERMEIGKTDDGQSVVFLDTGSDAIFSRRRALQIEWVADGTRRLTSCQSGHPSSVRKRDSVVRIL